MPNRPTSSLRLEGPGKRSRARRRRLAALLTAFACVLAWMVAASAPASATATTTPVPNPDAFTCNQPTSIGFEDFAEGTNLSATSFGGVDFTTTGGYTWQVLDFNTGYYNGKYPNGAYTAQGTHAAWLGTNQGAGRISFANGASKVSVLISAYTPILMEAYNSSGTLLESTPPSRSNIRTGEMDLLKISRSAADIAYVILHDSGNYFLVDSVCTDATVSKPGTDLSITKTESVDPIAIGGTETFTLNVTNFGPLDTDVVDVSDSVPAGFAVTSAVPSQGSCPSSGNSVVCNLGTLTVGASATITVTAEAVTAGTWSNVASVGSDAADPASGNNVASITTTVNGTPGCTINGTPQNDTLNGTAGDDVICGLAGNDIIRSSGGNDTYVGGPGSDTVSYANDPGPVTVDMATFAGTTASGTQQFIGMENVTGSPADDKLGGDNLNNTIDGGPGNDLVVGSAGNDKVRGGAGDDQLFGGPGSNGLDGGPGIDQVRYGAAQGPVLADLTTGVATSTVTLSDTLTGIENMAGSPYDDRLGGDNGPNSIFGAQGNDVLFGVGGDDVVSGAAGVDTVYGGTGTNTLDGGPGIDTMNYGSATGPVTASLVLGTGSAPGTTDQLTGFENLSGGPQSDDLTGDSGDNVVSGGQGGDDLLNGQGGNDQIVGGTGSDTASFKNAATAVVINLTNGTATGEGSDTLVSIESALGGFFADHLTGTNAANTLDGGAGPGADRLDGLGGPDQLLGFGGNDSLFGGSGNDNLDGGKGNDSLDGGANTDVCIQGGGTGPVVNCES